MENSEPPRSLYLHVPFCRSKCFYCDFFSVPSRGRGSRSVLESRIVAETLRQAERFHNALGIRRLETVYMGGGTPSCLPRPELARLLEALRGFSPFEWTVEANPESIDEEFIDLCLRYGVTRLSVGFQSNRDSLLSLLGRPGNREDNLRALELLGRKWRGEIGIDLLAGIPGQTAADLEADLSLLYEAGIGHISLYSLTVEPETELERMIRTGEVTANPEELSEEIWLFGKNSLQKAGYGHYEISNFALPGRECRHNLRYWRLEPYIGVGPGAVSTLTFSDAKAVGAPLCESLREPMGEAAAASVIRLSNPRDLGAFLAGEEEGWNVEAEPVGDRDFLLETLMVGLRTSAGIDRSSFARRFGGDFQKFFPDLWGSWVEEGLAESSAESLRLTEKGRLFLNRLLAGIQEKMKSSDFPPIRVHWPQEARPDERPLY